MTHQLNAQELRSTLNGTVLTPIDPDFESARAMFYHHDRVPAVVVRPRPTSDVVTAVRYARRAGLTVGVKSGGHGLGSLGVPPDGLLLDLGDMKGLDIDADGRTAWAEPGVTAGEYTHALSEHGLATGFGDSPEVGIGGIALSGGIGFLSRRHGLTIDNLLAVELVTATGDVVVANETHHPELFWALRGGGGNFGVATRFKFRLLPVDDISGGTVVFEATPEVVHEALEFARGAPDELTAILSVMRAPPLPFLPPAAHGKVIAMLGCAWLGDPEEGEAIISRLRALGTPLLDDLGRKRYRDLFPEAAELPFTPREASTIVYLNDFGRGHAEHVVSALRESDALMANVQLRVLGGAIARVPADATAYAYRDRELMAAVYTVFLDPAEEQARRSWVDDTVDGLDVAGGTYVGFQVDNSAAGVLSTYPESTLARLRKVKLQWDAENLFRSNLNVAPEEA